MGTASRCEATGQYHYFDDIFDVTFASIPA